MTKASLLPAFRTIGAIAAIASPLAATTDPQEPAAEAVGRGTTEVVWHQGDLAGSLGTAAATGKQVLVYFWMHGSDHCANLWGQTLTNPAASADLLKFVCHSADATTVDGAGLVQRFGITTLPTLLVLNADGSADDAMTGFVPLAAFTTEMRRIEAGTGTVAALRRAADAAPKDLNKRFLLGQKLYFVGDGKAGDAAFDSIRADDPEGTTPPGAELLLFDIRKQILDQAADKNDPATWNLDPMYDRLRRARQSAVLWKGWGWLARIEQQRGDPARQAAAWRAAWPHAPELQADEWGAEVLKQLWERRDAQQGKERTLARDIAKSLVRRDAERTRDKAPDPPSDETRSYLLSAAACGLAMAGKRTRALAALKRAKALAPDDRELDQLEQQIKR